MLAPSPRVQCIEGKGPTALAILPPCYLFSTGLVQWDLPGTDLDLFFTRPPNHRMCLHFYLPSLIAIFNIHYPGSEDPRAAPSSIPSDHYWYSGLSKAANP